jgi:hypothetical protein
MGRSGAHAGVVIDADIQERLIADLRNKLTQDATLILSLLGITGAGSLVGLIITWPTFSEGSGKWMLAIGTVFVVLLFSAIIFRLWRGPRTVVLTSYPAGSVVEAGSDGHYLWQASALGSTRVVLDVYSRMWLTRDSVLLRPKSSPLTLILPRRGFTEDAVQALEAHFAQTNRG